MLLVHVTHFNNLYGTAGARRHEFIDHGVGKDSLHRRAGTRLVVINNLQFARRRLGVDIFTCESIVPLDLTAWAPPNWAAWARYRTGSFRPFETRYRFFFFNPIRYTSLGLAVIEAMMIGLPIIGLATTEMAPTIENGVSGYVDTNVDRLIEVMQELLANPAEARRLGQGAQRYARERFNIERFSRDWDEVFRLVTGKQAALLPAQGVRV